MSKSLEKSIRLDLAALMRGYGYVAYVSSIGDVNLNHDVAGRWRSNFSFDLITKHLISLPIERGVVLRCSPIC